MQSYICNIIAQIWSGWNCTGMDNRLFQPIKYGIVHIGLSNLKRWHPVNGPCRCHAMFRVPIIISRDTGRRSHHRTLWHRRNSWCSQLPGHKGSPNAGMGVAYKDHEERRVHPVHSISPAVSELMLLLIYRNTLDAYASVNNILTQSMHFVPSDVLLSLRIIPLY